LGREGSGDCGIRVVTEESGVSKSSRHGAKRSAVSACNYSYLAVNRRPNYHDLVFSGSPRVIREARGGSVRTTSTTWPRVLSALSIDHGHRPLAPATSTFTPPRWTPPPEPNPDRKVKRNRGTVAVPREECRRDRSTRSRFLRP